jgi:transposase
MPSLAQRALAEWLGTAFLLAALVGSGILAQKLAGGTGRNARYSGSRRCRLCPQRQHALSSSAFSPIAAIRARGPTRRPATTGKWVIEIVKRNKPHKFVVSRKRWIVERTFAWITRNRRLARDFERYATTVAAFIRLAIIRLMLRRLTRSTLCP